MDTSYRWPSNKDGPESEPVPAPNSSCIVDTTLVELKIRIKVIDVRSDIMYS